MPDILETAKAKFEEARSAYDAALADFESRIGELPDTADVATVQGVIDEMQARVDEAKATFKSAKKQYRKLEENAEGRRELSKLIPAGDGLTVPEGTAVTTGREAPIYDRTDPFGPSFFSDLYQTRVNQNRESYERLERNTNVVLEDMQHRGAVLRDREGRAMSSTTGAGGDFLPPLYFGDLYAEFKRARRVTSTLVRNLPLAAKGNTITIPRITGGTAVAAQTADNQNVNTQDATTAILTVPVCTVAGYNDLSRQIVERSEPGLDLLLMEDLLKDYNKKVNLYVVNGSGSSGQPTGLLVQSSTNTVTYTSGSPTVYALHSKLQDAQRQIAENVFEETGSFVMTARRWAWIVAQTASDNRGIVVINAQGPFNALGVQNAANPSPVDNLQPVGWLSGIPVYVDETIPKTAGAGTNQDYIIGAAWNEHILWEDPAGPRQFTFEGVTSQTAAIRIQVFGYMAFTAGRFPAATSVVTGTGLAAPTF